MTREEALKHVKANIKNKNLFKHMLATEAIMQGLAEKFDEDVHKWGIAGLVHDIDYDETADDPHRHSIVGAEILEELGYDEDIVYSVKVHNDAHGLERKTTMDKALYSSDPLTGLIVAAALISPDKKLSKIDEDFILRRFDEKAFARGANREQIRACSEMGLELNDFISIGLNSMRNISKELGL
ncbi:HD domain-containing protein [Sporosalibacterium faouarense]|uniref:HD domain-containing protein n=1 Tax=Sporosalibacterium faouarense TaxID=516123 RepID=UPI00141CC875|nr:HD domain-containing protein [Sporosalibacterium faouarense]MTI46952.1 HDIG domain-containing protein [Bacillota bacterium]